MSFVLNDSGQLALINVATQVYNTADASFCTSDLLLEAYTWVDILPHCHKTGPVWASGL